MHALKRWLKAAESPLARRLLHLALAVRHFEIPAPRLLYRPLYAVYRGAQGLVGASLRVLWWTPLFKSRLAGPAPRLYLYGGLPAVLGPLHIEVGPDCRIAGALTISGRSCAHEMPQLRIGRNVGIGWGSSLAVGHRIQLGDNVRIAPGCLLAGYPGHPLDAARRAAGAPEDDAQVGDIVLEDDVWLASRVLVMAGVRIGHGSVVAAGSVVTRDLPAGVLAGGVPARVLRHLECNEARSLSEVCA